MKSSLNPRFAETLRLYLITLLATVPVGLLIYIVAGQKTAFASQPIVVLVVGSLIFFGPSSEKFSVSIRLVAESTSRLFSKRGIILAGIVAFAIVVLTCYLRFEELHQTEIRRADITNHQIIVAPEVGAPPAPSSPANVPLKLSPPAYMFPEPTLGLAADHHIEVIPTVGSPPKPPPRAVSALESDQTRTASEIVLGNTQNTTDKKSLHTTNFDYDSNPIKRDASERRQTLIDMAARTAVHKAAQAWAQEVEMGFGFKNAVASVKKQDYDPDTKILSVVASVQWDGFLGGDTRIGNVLMYLHEDTNGDFTTLRVIHYGENSKLAGIQSAGTLVTALAKLAFVLGEQKPSSTPSLVHRTLKVPNHITPHHDHSVDRILYIVPIPDGTPATSHLSSTYPPKTP